MKNQYTPGPWKYDSTWGLIKYGKTEICALHSGNEANAHLIAAAPDLLSALKEAIEYLETFACHDEQGRAAIKSANAAISKAEGVK